ncbi:MAG: hypothetical protein PVG94_02850 [Gammaproteobacteria bacterium]|jgi:hypothetical protein
MLHDEMTRDVSTSSFQAESAAYKESNVEAESNRSNSSHAADKPEHSNNSETGIGNTVSGEFVDLAGERFYTIYDVDKMPPFFITVVSDSDHWLFVSSTGGLTAGRVSPETALFPYVTVDKIHDNAVHTGCKSLVRVNLNGEQHEWEPFNMEHDGLYRINRNLYKNLLGNKLCFEEINHDLQLMFRYTWATSDRYGFIRKSELHNLGDNSVSVDIVDGLQNILPAGTPRFVQTNSSNLVDAYKWTELDQPSGMAFFTLYSGITDRAEPCESLKANTVFCLGLEGHKILISSAQLENFRLGETLQQEVHKRGVRGAYLVNQTLDLKPHTSQHWQLVANIEQSQSQVVELRRQLDKPQVVAEAISASVNEGSDKLARIIARGDGFQLMAEENVSVHHYANVLFNILRGGVFDDQYQVSSRDFAASIRNFNCVLYQQHQELLEGLPQKLNFKQLLLIIKEQKDLQLERLCLEYLPITFGRRHGDPSRPWNQFAIKLKDEHGNRLLSYEGNWRDIFQNWEALAFSYPEFIENVIAKFVNASTMDGYNPYRITKQGIDWEVEDPDDPWSYIGYWSDHQIIYLLKLLELSNSFHPARLGALLHRSVYSYANVPYRIKPFEDLLEDAKSTVEYDEGLALRIERRVAQLGADGKLVSNGNGDVYQVNLLEKLLVPLLGKLGNLVIEGGIWLNTQRPEWNDANNALVGQGLSMVTLYYIRRYISFLQQLLEAETATEEVVLSNEVSRWLVETAAALRSVRPLLGETPLSAEHRYRLLTELGQAASRYRQAVYRQEGFSSKESRPLETIRVLLDDALAVIDHSIAHNQRQDGLYHAYNLLDLQQDELEVDTLYPMLEGQVAVLSSGAITPGQSATVVEALFDSDVYRADQHSFMLYPDRQLPGFLDKNRVPGEQVEAIPLLQRMLAENDDSILLRDDDGNYRFNAELINTGALGRRLDSLVDDYGDDIETARQPLRELYEDVFNHKAFTGRSGGMFGFEGLGSIYWHMVSKLLLAVQENFFTALDQDADETVCKQLGNLYYRVRNGIGFNKTPAEYGAFPTDPYSHTPKHAGARQPGMTGQVKEEVLTRFGELGVRVSGGVVNFRPDLLRTREFVSKPATFHYLDVADNWQTITVPAHGLAFTWCQVPVVYQLDDVLDPVLVITFDDGTQQSFKQLALPAEESSELFLRSGRIRQLSLVMGTSQLFSE